MHSPLHPYPDAADVWVSVHARPPTRMAADLSGTLIAETVLYAARQRPVAQLGPRDAAWQLSDLSAMGVVLKSSYIKLVRYRARRHACTH